MNHTFYKLLKFECKLNFINWTIIVSTFIIIMAGMIFNKFIDDHSPKIVIGGSIIPLIILFSGLLTLHSYSESTNRQSMEMYNLLPVAGNIKFFTKQFFTVLIFPLVLLFLYLLVAKISQLFVLEKYGSTLFSPNIKPEKIATQFILMHAFATFFAIVFKKRKLLYTIAAFFFFQLIMVICIIIWHAISGNLPPKVIKPSTLTESFADTFPLIIITISIILYFISYRLFYRRQL